MHAVNTASALISQCMHSSGQGSFIPYHDVMEDIIIEIQILRILKHEHSYQTIPHSTLPIEAGLFRVWVLSLVVSVTFKIHGEWRQWAQEV